MKKIRKLTAILFGITAVSLMGVYLGLALYYRNAFPYGTWINNVYCTGKSIEQVNKELAKDFVYEGVTVIDKDGGRYLLSAEDIGYRFDFGAALEIYQSQQNPWMWVDSLFQSREAELSPVISYDRAAFADAFEALPFAQGWREAREYRLEIVRGDGGYALVNERMDVLSVEAAKRAVEEAIEGFQTEVSLTEAGCYQDLPLTEQMRETLAVWEKLERFQQCSVVYKLGEEEIPVDATLVSGWIATDGNGRFLLDEAGQPQLRENAIEDFVADLAARYDTVGASRQFRATRGGTVTVEGGLYGNRIDQEAEVAYLTKAFRDKRSEVHEPAYIQMAKAQGSEDIGSTYIEVDMGQQKMYYYADGVLEIDTPIVTGNISRRMGTPSGVNYVYAKQKNRILRGQGYASPVDFWMPVKGNIGIHDASWRGEFGGSIYQTNGSHGCINTPRAAMEKLYAMAEIGTPVIMFY